MTRRFLIAAALLVLGTIAQTAQAQHMPPGKWWRRPEIVRELELTRDQQSRLDEIFRAAADQLIDAKGEVEKLQIALRGELDRSQLRRAEVQRIATALSAARAKLFERELLMLVDMRGILNEEQWVRVRTALDREPQHRPMPGGQRPPGGGRRP
ncbi:MAG TPA: periplasmic heavy metal sensor [Thermoanaerobaculia bacterium]|nr:periplasmic heavy metal sensor [Thermoanaerobaculia bacterium]